MLPEVLLFWERAEDYRLGHPNAPAAAPPPTAGMPSIAERTSRTSYDAFMTPTYPSGTVENKPKKINGEEIIELAPAGVLKSYQLSAKQAKRIKMWATNIYQNFLSSEAPFHLPDVYLLSEEVLSISKRIDKALSCPPRTLFDVMQRHCLETMRARVYPAYLRHEKYKGAFQKQMRQASMVRLVVYTYFYIV